MATLREKQVSETKQQVVAGEAKGHGRKQVAASGEAVEGAEHG